MSDDALLRARGLRIRTADTTLVDGVDVTVHRGQALGIVGESGSGKSLTCRAMLGLVQHPLTLAADELTFDGQDLGSLTERQWCRIRGTRIGAVFQDPGSYLNPSLTIGAQVAEVVRVKKHASRRDARDEAVALLERLHLRNPARVARSYPHELSGGMLQRAMMALAIVEGPDLLIADEPTTALDATVQAEVLDLLVELREQDGLAVLFVSHDLAVVAHLCDTVMVMRDGRVVEAGPSRRILDEPQHPYTQSLIDAHLQYGLDRFRTREVAYV